VNWGVVQFPGSNDERDTLQALALLGHRPRLLWHRDSDVSGCDAIVLPGGFSYGDYLRCGAMARFSPVMSAIAEFAARGGPVLGICNGFQVLCEAGLLPGALRRNRDLRFTCRAVTIVVHNTRTAFTCSMHQGAKAIIPIKNGEGCFVAEPDMLERIEGNGQVVFRYCGENPNGSLDDIAGVCNEAGNVVGLMPHPEHAVDPTTGGTDGRALFASAAAWVEEHRS
jgi:phosphoribosylformylglycinamidine synthase